jgi:hypothetical protein
MVVSQSVNQVSQSSQSVSQSSQVKSARNSITKCYLTQHTDMVVGRCRVCCSGKLEAVGIDDSALETSMIVLYHCNFSNCSQCTTNNKQQSGVRE